MASTSYTAEQHPTPVSLLPLPEVERRTGLKKTKLYEMASEGEFPRPIKVGARSLWPSTAVEGWISQQITASLGEAA